MKARDVKAVLFDYDGVIADTMADNCRAWKRAFADFGATITDKEYYMLEGMSPAAIAKELGTQKGLFEHVIVQIPGKKAQNYRAHNSFRIYPGIPELLKKLKEQDMKLALVSGASRHRIEEMTSKELLSLFDVVVYAEDVRHPKPNPEPYQKALNLLHIAPDEAVVIENAPLGIQSAKAAGCFCIAVETTLPRDMLTDADKVILNHRQLTEQLC